MLETKAQMVWAPGGLEVLKLESASGSRAENSSSTEYSSSEHISHSELTSGAPLHSGCTPDGHCKNVQLNDQRLRLWLGTWQTPIL